MNTPRTTVGAEAAISRLSSYATIYQFGYTVTKVTPSGQVVVKRASDGLERRFDAQGYEMGSSASRYRRECIHFNVAEIRAAEAARLGANAAAQALNAVRLERPVQGTWGKKSLQETAAELRALLSQAEALIEAL